MIKKKVVKDKSSLFSEWRQISNGDLVMVNKGITLPESVYDLVDVKANEMGMSRLMFIELALASASPGSANWKAALRRYEKCKEERERLRAIKLGHSQSKKRICRFKGQKENKVDDILRRINDGNLTDSEIDEIIKKSGLTL